MFTNTSHPKKTLPFSWMLVLILAASGCAYNPPQSGISASNPPVTKTLFTGDFSYPESIANGWTGSCPNSAPPTVQQSPIDFTSITPTQPTLPTTVSVALPGSFDAHDNNIVFASVVTMTQGTKSVYTPLGFHFHSPVEHTLPTVTGPGISAPQLEIHIKMADKSGKVSVFAVQYQTNTAQAVNSQTLETLTGIMRKGTSNYEGVSLFNTLYLFQIHPFYSYVGSLTTPPCTTGVQFFVAMVPQQIPPAQMVTVLEALKNGGMPTNKSGQLENNRLPQQIASPAPVINLVTPATN